MVNNFEIRNPAIDIIIAIKVYSASNNNDAELLYIEAKIPVKAIITEPYIDIFIAKDSLSVVIITF